MTLIQRLFLCLILLPGWAWADADNLVGRPIVVSEQVKNGGHFMGIQLLGSLALRGDSALAELSGLAWDEDEQLLFAISDQGRIVKLAPRFSDGHLSQVALLAAHPLLDRRGKPLRGGWSDAEGLTLENSANGIRGDSRLIISFERHHRIERYYPDGRWHSTLPFPRLLRQSDYRPKNNRGLEAVTLHPEYGILTGPELPRGHHAPYLVNTSGRTWQYRFKEAAGALVALEALPNGDLILLERAYTSIFAPWVISLNRVRAADLARSQIVPTELIARFDSGQGWLTQNIEGLTRHQGMHFFMVSDDGNMPWAQTQLIYFKLLSE